MPFTFSHPAAILPFRFLPKTWFSMTGLVIGSLTPDFEYFLRMKINSSISHTTLGLFLFDLPLGILLTFIFHTLIRKKLIHYLPFFLKARFIKYNNFNWNEYFIRNWLIIFISLIIGAATHIIWDSFTHKDAYFVEKISLLTDDFDIFGKIIPTYKILQHTSSLVGGFLIILSILKLPKSEFNYKKTNNKYWVYIFLLSFVILILRFSFGLEFNEYGNIVVSSITSFLLSLIIVSILYK